MAPKLSALHMAFLRKDLSVVGIYIETCGGVPDHAAELRRHIARHRLIYPVLDGEAGPIDDPTFKRMSWAPHALVVDRQGNVLRTYPHMPRMTTLRSDLTALVETGLFPARPDDGWRGFSRGAWAEIHTDGEPRNRKTTLKSVSRDGVTITHDGKQTKLFREHLDRTDRDYRRTERKSEQLEIDGKTLEARVFDATWKRGGVQFVERTWIARGMVLRRKTLENEPHIERTERIVKWSEILSIGDRKVDCRVIERTAVWKSGRSDERVWISEAVPGHEARRMRKTTTKGSTSTETTAVVAFGLR